MIQELSFTSFTVTAPGSDVLLREEGDELVAGDERFGLATEGIWNLLRPDRQLALDQFATQYAAIRTAEHRELTPAEVQTLPVVRPDHPLADMWSQRAQSYDRFRSAIERAEPGHAVDIGAGCAWLAADLARDGWQSAAVDVTIEGGDGLAAARYHSAEIFLARAEMQALPYATSSIDLAVFNASLHYAANVRDAIREAQRVLRPGGQLAILDSPVFHDPAAGHMMVREFDDHVQRTHGLPAADLEGPGFVTEADLAGFDFDRIEATRGLRKRVQHWRGARGAGRETASRPVLIATAGGPR